jgi:hypothetical protein
MKWLLVIGNLVAAIAIVLAGQAAAAAHSAHVYSTYRELQIEKIIDERPDKDVLERLENIGGGGKLFRDIAWCGAAACLANAVTIAIAWPKRTFPAAVIGRTGVGVADSTPGKTLK